MIIITHTVVAAGARKGVGTLLAMSANNEVPQALTPTPINPKASRFKAKPRVKDSAIHAVAVAASAPPTASNPMPPIIHGVQRRP